MTPVQGLQEAEQSCSSLSPTGAACQGYLLPATSLYLKKLQRFKLAELEAATNCRK